MNKTKNAKMIKYVAYFGGVIIFTYSALEEQLYQGSRDIFLTSLHSGLTLNPFFLTNVNNIVTKETVSK